MCQARQTARFSKRETRSFRFRFTQIPSEESQATSIENKKVPHEFSTVLNIKQLPHQCFKFLILVRNVIIATSNDTAQLNKWRENSVEIHKWINTTRRQEGKIRAFAYNDRRFTYSGYSFISLHFLYSRYMCIYMYIHFFFHIFEVGWRCCG